MLFIHRVRKKQSIYIQTVFTLINKFQYYLNLKMTVNTNTKLFLTATQFLCYLNFQTAA